MIQETQQLEAAAEERRDVSGRSGGQRGGRGGLVLRELREGDERQLPGAQLIGGAHRGGAGEQKPVEVKSGGRGPW